MYLVGIHIATSPSHIFFEIAWSITKHQTTA
jgi:hypothetical protein